MVIHRGTVDNEVRLSGEEYGMYNRELSSSYASASAEDHSLQDDGVLLVEVSTPLMLLTMTPLLLVMYISFRMELSLEKPIIIGAVRTFVQLSVLGMILEPIFVRGETCGWLVIAYTILMVLLAAHESMNRSKYKFPGMYLAVLASLGVNVLWVSLFAFVVILKPTPLWDPQYVIPIVGMLLGNCINGIALSLNNMLTALVEQAREIELYLSFGATPKEATSRLMREAVKVGSMPQLNSMAIIGLISIPGMMTGQILGGSPVREAARYQMLIMYLIAMCTFGTILAEVTMALRAGFDTADRLRTDFFEIKSGSKKGVAASCGSVWSSFCRMCCCCFNGCSDCYRGIRKNENHPSSTAAIVPVVDKYDTEATGLLANDNPPTATAQNSIEFRLVRSSPSKDQATSCLLTISNLTHSFAIPEEEDEGEGKSDEVKKEATKLQMSTERRRRVLFEDLNLKIKAGEMVLISGESGRGKSTFLRLVAGLEPMVWAADEPSGAIRLLVKDDKSGQTTYDSQRDRTVWRNQVRYVPQSKTDLPGTPKQFIQRITSLHAFNHSTVTTGTIMREVRELLQAWGMDSGVALETEWSTLSGGEAQRVIVAIGMASRPRVLLLDESTSALDLTSKLQVEQSVVHYCQTYGTSVLWITHDPDQMERLSKSS